MIGAGGPSEEISGLLIFTEAARLVVHAGYDVEFSIACHAKGQIVLRAPRETTRDRRASYRDGLSDCRAGFLVRSGHLLSAGREREHGRMLMLALARALPCIATHVKGLRSLDRIGPGRHAGSSRTTRWLCRPRLRAAGRCRSRSPIWPERMGASSRAVRHRGRGRSPRRTLSAGGKR